MIVKCKKIYKSAVKKYHDGESDSCETIGKSYQVLEIYTEEKEVHYRIIPDDAADDELSGGITTPILIRAKDYDVVSGKIPANWVVKKISPTSHEFGPEKWLNNDYWKYSFWEDFCDSVPAALECYKEELKIIQATDSLDSE